MPAQVRRPSSQKALLVRQRTDPSDELWRAMTKRLFNLYIVDISMVHFPQDNIHGPKNNDRIRNLMAEAQVFQNRQIN